MMGYYGNWGMMWFGGIAFLLCFLVTVGLIVWATTRAPARPAPRAGDDTALATLRRRYAAGDISQEEFEQRRRVLTDEPAPSRGPSLP